MSKLMTFFQYFGIASFLVILLTILYGMFKGFRQRFIFNNLYEVSQKLDHAQLVDMKRWVNQRLEQIDAMAEYRK